MPPINQQGSRAGLITTLVVFAILFITSSVFAFQFYGDWQRAKADYAQYQKNYTEIVPLGEIPSAQGVALKTARETPAKFNINSNDALLDVAMHQRDGLAAIIRGSSTGDNIANTAADESAETLKKNNDALKAAGVADVTLPNAGLDSAINKLTQSLIGYHATVAQLTSQLKDTSTQLNNAKAETVAVTTANNQALDNAHKAAADDLAKANQATAAVTASFGQITTDQNTNAAQVQAATAAKDAELAEAKHQITELEKQIAAYKARLGNHRPTVENAAVRQADGKLVRVASNGVCYINLGFGDQVTPGLTFEVYDKAEGVPGIPENAAPDEQLPVGKGSIEITHVGTTSSECRIIKTTPGAVLTEGDLIANLVYDPHTKYNFFVYGKFDLANNGRPNDPDAEVIKRLVTQWGGKLGDEVNVNTDFVVLGAEPVVPSFSKDDITAENQEKINKAQEQLAKYQEIEAEAKDLHIPILNQNRFLYYVGFYDQAKR